MIANISRVVATINGEEVDVSQIESTLTIRFPRLIGRSIQIMIDVFGADVSGDNIRLRIHSVAVGQGGAVEDELNRIETIVLHRTVAAAKA